MREGLAGFKTSARVTAGRLQEDHAGSESNLDPISGRPSLSCGKATLSKRASGPSPKSASAGFVSGNCEEAEPDIWLSQHNDDPARPLRVLHKFVRMSDLSKRYRFGNFEP